MISVSIVEDLPEIRSSLERLVKEQQGMLLFSVSSNAEEAMPELIRTQPSIVIMDINMPGMNGIDCIRLVKDNCPATQFMIFTIYENDEKIFDALAAGASGYILKKTSSEKIIEAIKELYKLHSFKFLIASPKAPTPGKTAASAFLNSSGFLVITALTPKEANAC